MSFNVEKAKAFVIIYRIVLRTPILEIYIFFLIMTFKQKKLNFISH